MKKIYLKILVSSVVLVPVVGVGTYLGVSIYKSRNRKIQNGQSQQDGLNIFQEEENIFPELNQSTFYDFLVLKNGEPIITEKLISKVIKYVIPRIKTTQDKVFWSYDLSDDKTKCLFYFQANEDSKTYKKEYLFDVNIFI